MSIEIEFPLDRARCAMEPSQIQRSLFEDSGRQIFLARLELVIVGSVHVVVIWFVISFSSFRRLRFQKISRFLRAATVLAVIVLPAVLTCPVESKPNSKITKTKMIGVMLMAFSSHRQKIAAARKAEQNTEQRT